MRTRVVSCLFLLLALASPAVAADRQAEGRRSFDRILPEIRRHTPGTLYDAEGPFIGQDGQARYRVKWMTPEGRIVWFEVDARRGRILGMVTGTLPGSSGRRGREPDGYLPPYSSGDDGYDEDRYDGGSYDRNRRGNGRNDGASDRFRNWPGNDRGQDDRTNRDRTRANRDGDDGSRRRGGSGGENSGRGDSKRERNRDGRD